MKLLVVMNPSARDFMARDRWPQLEPLLRARAQLTLVETERDDAKTIAKINKALDAPTDRLLAIGGDGTVHLVANALAERPVESWPEFACIPFGTANNIAKSFGLDGRDLADLARIATGTKLSGLDVALLESNGPEGRKVRAWVNCAGVGIDADVVEARGRHRELGGYLAYAAALAERSAQQRSLDVVVVVDGVAAAARSYNVVLTGVPIYVGALTMPGARPDDQLLDLYLFDRVEYGSKVLSWAIKHADVLKLGISEALEAITQNQRAFHGRRISVKLAAPTRLEVDGEALELVTEMEAMVLGTLRIAVP